MKVKYLIAILILSLVGYLIYMYINKPSQTNVQTQFQIGTRTKTSNCQAHDRLPDSACTPGAIFRNATREQICVKGYSKSVRNVPEEEKKQVYEEYGIMKHSKGEYEVDHLISLELGGSNDIANLWPEASELRPGFHEKDMVENYLHEQVCKGDIALNIAQQQIAHNWLQVYQSIPNIEQYRFR